MGLGFLLALLTADNTRMKKLTRGVVFLPVVIGLAVSSLLWFWLFDQQVGLFNRLLVDVGVLDRPITWFTKPTWRSGRSSSRSSGKSSASA